MEMRMAIVQSAFQENGQVTMVLLAKTAAETSTIAQVVSSPPWQQVTGRRAAARRHTLARARARVGGSLPRPHRAPIAPPDGTRYLQRHRA